MSEGCPEQTAEEKAKKALAEAMVGTQAPDPVNLMELVERLRGLDMPSLAVLTPGGLQNLFNTLSRHLSECQGIVSDLQARTALAKKRGRTMRVAVQLAKRFLFQGDPEVRAGRSLVDREAVASVKLCREIIELQQAETEIATFESALILAQDRLRYLKDRRATLRDQKDLLHTDLMINGGNCGDGNRGSILSGGLRPTGPYSGDPDRTLAEVLDPSSAPVSIPPDEIRHIRSKSLGSG